jgi:hypothetical protein
MMSAVTRILIVANQTIGGDALSKAVSERCAAGACSFHLLVPVPPSATSTIAAGLAAAEAAAAAIFEVPDQRSVAADRLAAGLAWLASLGATATGEVGSTDAVASVAAVASRQEFDEVIVSTLPSRVSRWLKQDLPSRVAKTVAVPVTTVIASST